VPVRQEALVVPERFSYTSRISFLTWCRFSKQMTAFAESCVCHWFNLVQLSSAHDSFPRRGGSPEADYGGSAGRFCGHHASVGSRNYRSPGAAATAVMSAHEARSAFARNHAQKMLDLVIADESAFILRSPYRRR
jgi:hypothetical protein